MRLLIFNKTISLQWQWNAGKLSSQAEVDAESNRGSNTAGTCQGLQIKSEPRTADSCLAFLQLHTCNTQTDAGLSPMLPFDPRQTGRTQANISTYSL